MRYFDTGVLLKLYLPEPRATEAMASGCEIRQSWRAVLPAGSIARGKKAGQRHGSPVSQTECDALIAQVQADLSEL